MGSYRCGPFNANPGKPTRGLLPCSLAYHRKAENLANGQLQVCAFRGKPWLINEGASAVLTGEHFGETCQMHVDEEEACG